MPRATNLRMQWRDEAERLPFQKQWENFQVCEMVAQYLNEYLFGI